MVPRGDRIKTMAFTSASRRKGTRTKHAKIAGMGDNEDDPEAPTTEHYEQAHRKVMQRMK